MNGFRFMPLLAFAAVPASMAAADDVDFRRDVLPILSNHCFACHGRDAKARKAKLRLDDREQAVARRKSGDPAIVPNKPESSGLIVRIDASDAAIVMPPPEFKRPLTGRQRETLRK